MCAIVTIGDNEYETVQDIKKVCPRIVKADGYDDVIISECCLCQLDLEETAKANGFMTEWHNSHDVEFFRKG